MEGACNDEGEQLTLVKVVLTAILLHQLLMFGLYKKFQKQWIGRVDTQGGWHTQLGKGVPANEVWWPRYPRTATSLSLCTDLLPPWWGFDMQSPSEWQNNNALLGGSMVEWQNQDYS